jgi:hypothetical protein
MKPLKKKITFIFEKTRTGFSAYADGLPIATTGRTIPTLRKNILEALNLFLEDTGYSATQDNIALQLNLQQFFTHYKVLNARKLAEHIGMNPTLLSQYVSGRKKPSATQQERILRGIQELGRELAGIRLGAE